MEIFRELFLRGSSDQLAALMDEVEKSLPPGWTRIKSNMVGVRAFVFGTNSLHCFEHYQDDALPSARVYLAEKEPGLLFALNIHPQKKRLFSHGEYNAILEHFCNRIVRPCAEKMGVSVELTGSQADLNTWLSDTAAEKLRTFSTMANKGAGYLLPQDQERWLDFILTAHRQESRLDASTLRRWLIEIEGWSPEIADQLTGEYAFGGELLTFSESRRAGA